MTWREEKTKAGKDLIWDGAEYGIAPSPTKGNANLQNVNISTETGEAMMSFGRIAQQQAAITNGTLTASVSDGAYLLAAPANLNAGDWITVSATTIPALTAVANYLAVGGGGGGGTAIASEASGGGGAGGMLTGTFTPSVQSYPIIVGAGGATSANGGNTAITPLMPQTLSVQTLVVGAGGGGGASASTTSSSGGGGGAGSVKTQTFASLPIGTYSITIGTGGAAGTTVGQAGSNGTSTTFGSLVTAAGGGGGGGASLSGAGASAGLSGASGGGGGAGVAAGAGGTATDGFAGGSGSLSGSAQGGGGGGSAEAGNTDGQKEGGDGVSSSITGTPTNYGGGGGGGGSSAGGGGGDGGGGAGGNGPGGGVGAAGTANTGGGGGGGATNAGNTRAGGVGGSGVVIIRFTPVSGISYNQSGGVVTTTGGDTVITFTSSGTLIIGNALGGGAGASPSSIGSIGGSGGGGSSGTVLTAGTGTTGQGHNGGTGFEGTGSDESGGGGGGATAVGSNGISNVGGAGGAGTASSISGASVTYAGGGGGGAGVVAGGAGGVGGGGQGMPGVDPTTFGPGNGTNGLGGGGGGNFNSFSGGTGGSGVVIISYVTGSMNATGGSITTSGGNTIHTFYGNGTFTVQSIATLGRYYVSYKDASNKVKLSAAYDPYSLNPIAHGTSGTATFSTLTVPNQAISKATEKYTTATTTEYRYYFLDVNGYVWVYDTAVYTASLAASGIGTLLMLPDPTDYSAQHFNNIAVLSGWLMVINKTKIQGKQTPNLGSAFATLDNAYLQNPFSTHTNFALTGHQGRMYYCDGNYVGSLFPDTSLLTGVPNIQSFATYTFAGDTGTVTSIIEGSLPYTADALGSVIRIPVVFFPDQNGTLPAGLLAQTIYYIQVDIVAGTFQIYTTRTGGIAITITAVGTQFFNTFYPLGTDAGIHGTNSTVTFSPQRLNLPEFESAQCMVEIGNTVLIGGITNTLYPWNQIDTLPSDLIALPESDVRTMINVNNVAYVFAGNKGNIYISNLSVASLVSKVPDYCAGIPGTPLTYIEPRFTWGDSMYLRGRVYFSILDQTSTKVGNCGGVWSFIPAQNFASDQDIGLALRLENQNSYGTYSGNATILIPAEQQNAISPQYWAAWQDSYNAATSSFGIDFTSTNPSIIAIIETDLAPTGTFFDKQTFKQIEYKMTTQMTTGDSVQLYYRLNSTDAWLTCGNIVEEAADRLSGYFVENFQNSQWIQFRAVLTTGGTTSSSFNRFKEIRLR